MPVISSNARLETYIKGLEDAAVKNNAYLFESTPAAIDGELEKAGVLALPDI
jgi:hypothetical protein